MVAVAWAREEGLMATEETEAAAMVLAWQGMGMVAAVRAKVAIEEAKRAAVEAARVVEEEE